MNNVNQYTSIDDDSSACPGDDELPTHDSDGNLTQDADFDYEYDGENRLISVTPRSPISGDRKVTYTYDYLGRRVEKKVFVHTGLAWPGTPDSIRRFIWYNWLLLVEYEDDSGTNRVKRAYTWGLDLSQNSLESAGGIGGLVAFEDRAASETTGDDQPYFAFYDTHGNVGQLVGCEDDYGAASGAGWHTDRMAARYEYDAFGIVVGPDDDSDDNWRDDAGSYASDNPIRFSTKYFDDETAPDQGSGGSTVGLSSPFAATQGLGYWGYRFYDPRRGRWTNRDPIEERGGYNLYAAMRNAATREIDPLGRACQTPPQPCHLTTSSYEECTKCCAARGERHSCFKACDYHFNFPPPPPPPPIDPWFQRCWDAHVSGGWAGPSAEDAWAAFLECGTDYACLLQALGLQQLDQLLDVLACMELRGSGEGNPDPCSHPEVDSDFNRCIDCANFKFKKNLILYGPQQAENMKREDYLKCRSAGG